LATVTQTVFVMDKEKTLTPTATLLKDLIKTVSATDKACTRLPVERQSIPANTLAD
jgi:hypothetical protein